MTVAGTITTPTQLHAVSGAPGKLERLYGADFWHAAELGVPAARGRDTVSFSAISPPWLRQAAKAWARHRLVLNYAFNTVRAAALAFKRFSTFLHSRPARAEPGPSGPATHRELPGLARSAAFVRPDQGAVESYLRAFLEENRRYRWVSGVPLDAVVYHDEVPARRASLPRFLPESVMAQLESEANLARLRPDYRHLVVLLTETGLRVGDACALPFNPLIADSTGWPCLRFQAHKMRAEQMVPLSDKAARAVRDQQSLVARAAQGVRGGCSRPPGSPSCPRRTTRSAWRSTVGNN